MPVCFEFTTIVNLEDRTCGSRENKEIKKLSPRVLVLTRAACCSQRDTHAHDHITDARVRGDDHTTGVVLACANLASSRLFFTRGEDRKVSGLSENVSRTESINKHMSFLTHSRSQRKYWIDRQEVPNMKSRGVGKTRSKETGNSSSFRENELDDDEDFEVDHTDTTQDSALKRPLIKYPVSSSRITGRRKQPLTHAPKRGGFRIRHGIQVSLT